MKLSKRLIGTHPEALARSAGAAIARGVEEITSRAVPPFWRASTNAPSTDILRATFIAAGSDASTSVSVVASAKAPGASIGAERIGAPSATGTGAPPVTTSTRLPRIRSWAA